MRNNYPVFNIVSLIICIVFWGYSSRLLSQVTISPGRDTAVCAGTTVPLTANFPLSITVPPPPGYSPSYTETNIPFNILPAGGTTVNVVDDQAIMNFPIGFNFTYFGNTYSYFNVSPNGWIGFGSQMSSTFSFNVNDWDSNICLGNYPANGILAAFQDFNPESGGSITFQTIGSAPNRILVVSYNDVPFYNDPANPICPGPSYLSTFQIRLYETSNNIEIHIQKKPKCTGLWGGQIRIGLARPLYSPCNVSTSACSQYAISGSDTELNNWAVRYSPQALPASVNASFLSLEWTQNGSTSGISPGPNSPTINAVLPGAASPPRRYIAKVDYTIPCGGRITFRDTVTLSVASHNTDFTVVSPVCAGESSLIQFAGATNPSASATITYDFGSDATPASASTLGPHSVSWTNPGTKNITLSISGGTCATGSSTRTVEVSPPPTSTFNLPVQACRQEIVNLDYTGNAPAGAEYIWDFDGGIASNGNSQNPAVEWSTEGVKNISLKVVIGSCTSSVTSHSITIRAIPDANFALPLAGCQQNEVTANYTGTAGPSATFTWDFDGGTSSLASTQRGPHQISWSTSGFKTVSLTVSENGCNSTVVTKQIQINAAPVAEITAPSGICVGSAASVTASPVSGASYTFAWDGGIVSSGSGAGPFSVSWNSSGSKSIQLQIVVGACSSAVVEKIIEVIDPPNVDFTINPTSACIGAPIQLEGPAGLTLSWSFPGADELSGATASSRRIRYNNEGLFTVSLIGSVNGCTSTPVNRTITIHPTPSADFTITSAVCPGDPATVEYKGSGSENANYSWGFDGGVSFPGPSPVTPFSVSWNNSGLKAVSLVVEEGGCASQPYSKNVNVYELPEAMFEAESPVCVGSPSNIQVHNATGTFDWNYDGASITGSGNNFQLTWSDPGIYTVQLTVVDNGCISERSTVLVTVNEIPEAEFILPDIVCASQEVQTNYTGTPNPYIFEWEMPGAAAGPGPMFGSNVISWDIPGTYPVKLEVWVNGCKSPTYTRNVTVIPPPEVNAGSDLEVCSGETVEIGSPPLPGLSYSWSPQTGLESPETSLSNVSFINTENEAYSQQYILSSNNGVCTVNDTMTLTVRAPQQVFFETPEGQCFNSHSFTFLAEGDFSENAEFSWSLGDEVIPFGNNSQVTDFRFPGPGVYTVMLQAKDGNCLSNEYRSEIKVFVNPVVEFEISETSGCVPLGVSLKAFSNAPPGSIYFWYTGEGKELFGQSAQHTFFQPGIYPVRLYVETPDGCISELEKPDLVEVWAKPDAGFEFDPMAKETSQTGVSFVSTLENPDLEISYFITPGDTTLYGAKVHFSFRDTGVHSVLQRVIDLNGCTNDTLRTIRVKPVSRFFIPNSFSPNSDGINDLFLVRGTGLRDFKIEIFNRWGELVYTSFDIDNGWDGTVRVSEQTSPPGIYWYRIFFRDLDGDHQFYEGFIHLLR